MKKCFLLLLGLLLLSGVPTTTLWAQIALEGSVLDEHNRPIEARVLLGGNKGVTTNPDGTFSLSLSDWREIQTIKAEKEGYSFQKYELNRTQGVVTIFMFLNTFEVRGKVENVRGRAVQGAHITVPSDPQIVPVYSNPKGVFVLKVPKGSKLTRENTTFQVDDNTIPPTNVILKGDRIRLIVPENTSRFPVYQVRVHDTRQSRMPGATLTVGGRAYQADEEGVIQIMPDHNLSKEVSIESANWELTDRSYDPIAEVLNVYLGQPRDQTTKDSSTAEPAEEEEENRDYGLTLDQITSSLEKEGTELADRRIELIQQIEALTEQLAEAPELTRAQRTQLTERLYRLEKVLGDIDAAYERNRRRTDSLMLMMRTLILEQKEELERTTSEREVIKNELFNTLEEKIQAEEEYERRLRFALVFGLVLLAIMAGTYFFLIRIRRQKRELEELHSEVSENNRKITDNMRYAKDIQDTILPREQVMQAALGRHFILFRPLELVSGDFYWVSADHKPYTFVAVVDCTGHGISGAFMSMIGYTVLNEIVNQKGVTRPEDILNELHFRVRIALKQESETNDDGMDVCLCRLEKLDEDFTELVFAGAKRALYLYRNHEIEVIRGTSRSIGGRQRQPAVFEQHTKRLRKGDRIYLTTDGLADQNNPKRKKLGTRQLLQVIEQNAHKTMYEQEKILEDTLEQHQGEAAQRDDITVLGIEV